MKFENYRKLSIGKAASMLGAIVMLVGLMPTYVEISDFGAYSLFKIYPICGVVVIVSAITILIGPGLDKSVIPLVGAAAGLLFNIATSFIIKSESFFYKFSGTDDLGVLGDVAKGIDMHSMVTYTFEIGFDLILIGSLLATVTLGIIAIDESKSKSGDATSLGGGQAFDSIKNGTKETKPTITIPRIVLAKRDTEWTCGKCSNKNAGKSSFCVYCGAEKPKPRICYSCDTFLEDHMMFCPTCGTEYNRELADKRYCEILEAGAEEISTVGNVCKYCGAELPEGAMFCGKCGEAQ